jgi:hypothetical protein
MTDQKDFFPYFPFQPPKFKPASKSYWSVRVALDNGKIERFRITGLHLLGNAISSRNLTEIRSITLT